MVPSHLPKTTSSVHPKAPKPRAPLRPTPLGRGGPIFSNYNAPPLGFALTAGGTSIPNSTGPVTYTIANGQFAVETPTTEGFTASLTSSVTLSGDPNNVNLGDVYVIFPPNYQGTDKITEQFSDGTPTATVNVNVLKYDDGSYESAIQDLGTISPGSGMPANPAPTAAPPTGVVQGIDWSTLTKLGRTDLSEKDPKTGVVTVETGTQWQVKTVKGSTITLFEDDPYAQQPAASRANPNFVDPSYNCHGYSFGAAGTVTNGKGAGIVDKNGVAHTFQIYNDASVKAILADAYTEVDVDQAFAAVNAGKKVYFVFYDANGAAAHSAVNSPGQTMSRRYFFNYTWLGDGTQVSSKNGNQAFSATTIGALKSVYPDTTIKMYILNQP